MTNKGKQKCEMLKLIRKRIAEQNGIEYQPTSCHHHGECLGSCPKCEAETRLLQKQLILKQKEGRALHIVGIATSLLALSACSSPTSNRPVAEESEEVDSAFIAAYFENDDAMQGDFIYPPQLFDSLDDLSAVYLPLPPEPDSEPLTDKEEIISQDSLHKIAKDTAICRVVDLVAKHRMSASEFTEKMGSMIYDSEEYKNLSDEAKKDLWYILEFNVERDGRLTDLTVRKSADHQLDDLLLRTVAATSGEWLPSIRHNRKVRSRMGLCVHIKDGIIVVCDVIWKETMKE